MQYEYWFANLKGLSGKRKQEIRKVISPQELYYMKEKALESTGCSEKEEEAIKEQRRTWDLKSYEKLQEQGIKCVALWQDRYPEQLKQIAAPPYMLYVKGTLPDQGKSTAAIVGARECSPYGEAMAREFSSCLAKAGMQIVSGMARGIDSAGQRGALETNGKSFAVLGCGVDICYPREEIGLYMELVERGGVISEYAPGTPPLRQHFPARNRIISGMADVILVMEAKEKSGSLITADMALEQGKDVFALPGPVNSVLSKGCNGLIKQGAGILTSPQELLEELGMEAKIVEGKFSSEKLLLESAENIVYSCLDFTPQNLNGLIRRTGLRISELTDVLIRLELMGAVKEISKNYYVKLR